MSDLSWLNPTPHAIAVYARDHCRQRSRNTRYQAGAAPYLGRSSTGWIAPACLAHSLNHLVRAGEQRRRHIESERIRRPEVHDHSNMVGCSTGRAAGFAPLPRCMGSIIHDRLRGPEIPRRSVGTVSRRKRTLDESRQILRLDCPWQV